MKNLPRPWRWVLIWALVSGLVHVTWELGWCLYHAHMASPEAQSGPMRILWLYAIADRRYYINDPFILSLEWFTVLAVTPMNFYVVLALRRGKILAAALVTLIFSTMELYGAILYFGAEGFAGWEHLSRRPVDLWLKVITLNGIWIVVPGLCVLLALRTIVAAARSLEQSAPLPMVAPQAARLVAKTAEHSA